MKSIAVISVVIVCTFITGCNFGCISLAGNYKDFGGEVTWCQDKAASQNAQRNVLSDENGNEATLVTDEEIVKINDALEAKISAAGIRSFVKKDVPPMEKLTDLLRKLDTLK